MINHSLLEFCLCQGSRSNCLLVTLIARHTERYICLYRFSFCRYFVNYKRDVPSAITVSLRTRLSAKRPVVSIWENRRHVFLSREFSLARARFNHPRPVDFESMLPSLCVQIHLKLDIFNRRPSKDAALEKFKLAMSSPITPSNRWAHHKFTKSRNKKC